MPTVVLLGGNGYIGRNVLEKWLKNDPQAEFYVVSRSGKNLVIDARVHNLKIDVTSYESVNAYLPEHIDYIVDFIGKHEKDEKVFRRGNDELAQVMMKIAEDKHVKAMGFIGGLLGPKQFLEGKKRIERKLRTSNIRVEVIEPTLVYGNGRNDILAKMVPVFKILGHWNKKIKPVHVSDVATELVQKMCN